MKTLKNIISVILVPVLLYGIGSFYSADFNIANWTETTRFTISFLSLILIGIVVLFIKIEEGLNF